MNPLLNIAGSSAAWELRDSLALTRWLDSQPWKEASGDAIALRLDAPDTDRQIESLLIRNISAYAYTMPGICTLLLRSPASSLRRELAVEHELPAEHSAWDFVPQLAQSLDGRPLIVLIHLAPALTDTALFEAELQQLTDAARKSVAELRLLFVFFVNPTQTLGSVRTFDLTTGEPRTELFRLGNSLKAARWAAFTHLRLAWECAGQPLNTIASGLWWQVQPSPSVGSESELEVALNAHAGHVGSKYDKSIIESVRQVLRRSSPGPEALDLARRGLLWRQHADAAFTVAPWLARLWLRQGCTERERPLLRNSLNCAWLSRDLLSRCLALESRIRHRHSLLSGLPTNPPSDDACRPLNIACNEASGMSAYPIGHPSPPQIKRDEWLYASLGEWEAAHPSAPGFWRDLLRIRNALAHEHYVGWRHLVEITRLGEMAG